MEYQHLNSTQPEVDGSANSKKPLTDYLTRRNLIIAGFVALSTFLFISIGFNIYSMTQSCPIVTRNSMEDQRLMMMPQSKAARIVHNGTQVIECQREFFLFHQDQNHVCEVSGLMIKNDTEIVVKGNQMTTVLHIFSFEVYKIPKEIFKEFKNLKNLIVNGNHLEVIEENTFDAAENLEVLRLSNNDLKELKSLIFQFMQNLKTLDLGRNKIEQIETEVFTGLDNLERLYLSDNNLKRLPSDVFYPLQKLLFLSLENNRIDSMDDDIFMRNKKIKSLGLSNNTFKDLQNEVFHYFENLTDLSISELRIDSLDLNGTSVSTLVMRNTDLRNLTLNGFPKILVCYGSSNLEVLHFIVNEHNADFKKIPNWGGMFFNKNIRFIFYFKKEVATTQNLETYDAAGIRKHIFLPERDYQTADGAEFTAVEYIPRIN